MATNNGAWFDYDDYSPEAIFFRSSPRFTKEVTVLSGVVLKARSFVESNSAGKMIAHTGITEAAVVTFTALTNGQTMIIAGLTFTAGASGTTAAELTAAWSGIASGTGYADIDGEEGGTFTAGTLTAYFTENVDTNTVVFNAAAANTDATDVAATGTGSSAATIVISAGSTAFKKIAGLTVYDVDASSADVKAAVFTEASLWASAITWKVDAAVDTITKSDGTTQACSAYNTGAFGTSAASDLMKQKFVEGSEFEPLGFTKAGEVY